MGTLSVHRKQLEALIQQAADAAREAMAIVRLQAIERGRAVRSTLTASLPTSKQGARKRPSTARSGWLYVVLCSLLLVATAFASERAIAHSV